MNAAWKDGILLLLRKANEAFNAGQKEVGAALLVTAIAAQDDRQVMVQ